jgi:hypothetical protein
MGEGVYGCEPKYENGTGCSGAPAASRTVESVGAAGPATSSITRNFEDYLKSVYREIGARVSSSSPSIPSIIFPTTSRPSAGMTSMPKAKVSTSTVASTTSMPESGVSSWRSQARARKTQKSKLSMSILQTEYDEHTKPTGYYEDHDGWFKGRLGVNEPVLIPSTSPSPSPSASSFQPSD